MKVPSLRSLVVLFSLAASISARASYLTGRWDLKIEDKSHHAIAVLAIEFTDRSAPSCIAGNWYRVKVVSASTTDATFYPVSEPLSFHVENGHITIGRNEICDGYLMLKGEFDGERAHGDYFSLEIGGSSALGFFTLNRGK